MPELEEYCGRCHKVTPSIAKRRAFGTEYVCAVFGHHMDWIDDDPEEDGYPRFEPDEPHFGDSRDLEY
jgi:hypothetical protein